MPSIVTEVSAMLVATTTCRREDTSLRGETPASALTARTPEGGRVGWAPWECVDNAREEVQAVGTVCSPYFALQGEGQSVCPFDFFGGHLRPPGSRRDDGPQRCQMDSSINESTRTERPVKNEPCGLPVGRCQRPCPETEKTRQDGLRLRGI